MAEPAQDAHSRLTAFMAAMNDWERTYYPLMEENAAAHLDQARQSVGAIFDEYVSSAAKRVDRRASPHTSLPPEYDPNAEVIDQEDVGEAKAVIATSSSTGFRQSYRYTLVVEGSKWMITRKEVLRRASGKWELQAI